jgi:deoxyribodipyrimidine photolyase-related protein
VQEAKMSRTLFIPFDQLNRQYGVLKNSDPNSDSVVFIESQRMLTGRNWHKQRLQFLVSSARHFAEELRTEGFEVAYLKAATTVTGLTEYLKENPNKELICATPNSFKMREALLAIGVTFVENDFFLTSEKLFKLWADDQKSYTMENFYRAQRRRLNILMLGDKPVGDQWNFDADNRLPPPKDHDWGKQLTFRFDEIDEQVKGDLPNSTWGELDQKIWGTTRAEALKQMKHFFDNHFNEFGPYEDAMPKNSWTGHHSLLSPYLNNGLLHPKEVVKAALAKYESGSIPLASCEGFIRQVIGWREYINGMYWYLGEDYRDNNGLAATRKLLPLFYDPSKTKMNCIKSVVSDVKSYGWTHHALDGFE